MQWEGMILEVFLENMKPPTQQDPELLLDIHSF